MEGIEVTEKFNEFDWVGMWRVGFWFHVDLAVKHLFEQLSVKRELHVAGMLLRRGIGRVTVAETLAWVKSDPLFVR